MNQSGVRLLDDVVSLLPHAEFRPNNYREEAPTLSFKTFDKNQLKEKEINEENGDLAHQESAKLKHMLLIAENENQKLKQQLASTQAGDLENISSENAILSNQNSRFSAEIEELKLAKLELDEQTTKQKYQIENFEAENRRLKAEHKELTEERRRLVDDRAKLAEEFEQKIKIISDFEKSNETNENELEQLNSRFSELEAENSSLLEKLEEAEQVNKRLKEGNLKVQDHEGGFQIVKFDEYKIDIKWVNSNR